MQNLTKLLMGLGLVALTVGGLRGAGPGGGQSVSDFENVLQNVGDAIVTVKYVSKTSDGESQEESDEEFYGVMIDPKGIVLCSSSKMAANSWGGSSVPTDIKVLAGEDTDGAPAKVLARDSELDLLWLKIKSPREKPYAFVDLARGATPRLGDRLLSIEKKSDFYDRASVISEDRLGGIMKRPRDLYAPSRGLFSDIGMPVFSADGGLVGFFVEHSPEAGHLEAAETDWSDTAYLILPTASVAKATQTAMKSGGAASAPTPDEDEENEE